MKDSTQRHNDQIIMQDIDPKHADEANKSFYGQTVANVWLAESVTWPQSNSSCVPLDEVQIVSENPL